MGAGFSGTETPPIQLQMEEMPPNYPDMNVIFKGIPKMMQVADDMHRMTNYIMDLRNMMLAVSAISSVGMFIFLILKYVHLKNSRRRRRRFHPLDSDQTSLSRMGDIAVGGVSSGVNGSRYYGQQKYHPFSAVNNLEWAVGRHVPVDMEKLLESQHSTSTVATPHHHVSHNVVNSGSGGSHRQTPPQLYTPFSRTMAYHSHQSQSSAYHYQSANGNAGGNSVVQSTTAGGTASGSATSGATTSTVAIGDENLDQVEIPYSLSENTIPNTAANGQMTTNAPSSGAKATTANGGLFHYGHPLIVANGGVTSYKVGEVSSAMSVLTTTINTIASK